MIVASAWGGEQNAIIAPRAVINSVSNGDGRRRMVDCCRSSEIILEGFVFSLALPTVLLIYSAGVPTVSLFPRRAAGSDPLLVRLCKYIKIRKFIPRVSAMQWVCLETHFKWAHISQSSTFFKWGCGHFEAAYSAQPENNYLCYSYNHIKFPILVLLLYF